MESAETIRVGRLFNRSRHKGFGTRASFNGWWFSQCKVQNDCCFYCETSIALIQKLIKAEKISTRRIGWGFRGANLEVDRKDSKKPYTPENCVLCCYYCNNDKSDVYSWDEYKRFFGPARKQHFEYLAAGCK